MSDIRGLPLLSGPPPSNDLGRAEIACRKCSKEFNILFTRSRKCNHCGYSYCHNCSDFQALMPRSGPDTGYDVMNVCAFCIEYLTITAGGRSHLKSLSLGKLRKYVNAYNIKTDRAVEKDDIIDAIMNARTSSGCLPRNNEQFYRQYSVPDRSGEHRSRGIFSRPSPGPPPNIPPRPRTQPTPPEFARPDLAPDTPSPPRPQSQRPTPGQGFARPDLEPGRSQQGPPPPPRPAQYQSPPYPNASTYPPHYPPHQPPPQQGAYNPQYNAPPYTPYHRAQPQPPPRPPQNSRPQQYQHPHSFPSFGPGDGPYQQPQAARSSHNVPGGGSNINDNQNNNNTPPRPRATSAAPPPTLPPPSLDALLNMTPEAIAGLSIHALKSILFTNHVNAGLILEKGDLVTKVKVLIEDERRDRERQRAIEEQEEAERIELQRQLLEEHNRAQREREERTRAHSPEAGAGEGAEGGETVDEVPIPVRTASPTSKAHTMAANLERTGLCVICQDEEANIAIVDCGHLAMCRGCSDLVMASSRECPLCRTRIVTEARLLRIFKT